MCVLTDSSSDCALHINVLSINCVCVWLAFSHLWSVWAPNTCLFAIKNVSHPTTKIPLFIGSGPVSRFAVSSLSSLLSSRNTILGSPKSHVWHTNDSLDDRHTSRCLAHWLSYRALVVGVRVELGWKHPTERRPEAVQATMKWPPCPFSV